MVADTKPDNLTASQPSAPSSRAKAAQPPNNAFGQQLKNWRAKRDFSQLSLSLASGVSQRHISFLESGRAQPSREMILKLAAVMDVPLRQQNKLLTTAGFAPIYAEGELSDPEFEPIRRALNFTLRKQEPYPALVMDRYWNQMQINQGAAALIGWLVEGQTVPDHIGPNLMKLMLHPAGIRAQVKDWEAIAPHLIHRVHRESLSDNVQDQEAQNQEPSSSQSLFEEILTYPDVRSLWQAPLAESWSHPMMTVTFTKQGTELSFFTTLATLGTPRDITLQELRIECMFPADNNTEEQFQALLS